ncbi:MAG: RNA 2',3'-cyclic phosphodiesterase [Brevundimonas sp.]|uniref:RNA 2',3'-cyclic phosphodiesterase n=1 Tax=Brevundimonas sp. TaxID=1871086 RepID=UPI001A318E0B|nr:RNA 2',3'-cyclic phosphodiesterase [Brevundimonas sp.]MBJ7447561.1 RNA 2',3'-cyclic phosphodiesterase [Brevundimonas sp.]
MIRLFTALSIPEDVAESLAARQTGLPGARWRTAEQLHVTLAFYGEIDERRADDLALELERAQGTGSFEIELAGVGAFGDAHRSHTLWAGVAASERLNVLAGRCKAAAERAGVKMEKRTYHPHVTLAYLNSQTDPARLGAWVAQNNLLHSPPIRIDQFGLYSSTLKSDGSLYQLEQVYRL